MQVLRFACISVDDIHVVWFPYLFVLCKYFWHKHKKVGTDMITYDS